MFYTYAKRDVPDFTHWGMMKNIARLCETHCAEAILCFEMGVKAYPDFQEIMEERGLLTIAEGMTHYGRLDKPRPCMKWIGSADAHTRTAYQGKVIPDFFGNAVIMWTLENFVQPGDMVADFFCGVCDFIRPALDMKANIFGIELRADKLEKGLRRIERMGYHMELRGTLND